MAVYVLLFIAFLIVGLNWKPSKQTDVSSVRDKSTVSNVPVAQKYRVLYWFAAFHILYTTVVTAWMFVFSHPWDKFTVQYDKLHHYHQTIAYLQLQDKIIIASTSVVLAAFYLYIILSRKLKNVTTALKVALGLDTVRILSNFETNAYHMALYAVVAGFTLLALCSLKIEETDFLKMLRKLWA
jgi:hypothetical protein